MKSNEKMEQILHDLEVNTEFSELINQARKASDASGGQGPLLMVLERFGVDWDMFNYIREKGTKDLRSLLDKIDLCVVGYTIEEDLFGFGPYTEGEKKLHRKAFPVTIDIHRSATKTDVINFIRKNWYQVEKWRTFVNGEGSKDIPRKRKRPNEKLNYFLYENRDLKVADLKRLVKENFKRIMVYDEIYSLIRAEQKRRDKPLKTEI